MRRSFFIAVLFTAACLHAEEMRKPKLDLFPDTVVLNDGTTLHGLIVRNDATTLTLQQRTGEKDISKKSIRIINDDNHAAAYFADIANPGKLPPWRMVVQDFRCDDNIRSFREVPATRIDTGYLRDIPYLSFRINERVEMNVYGIYHVLTQINDRYHKPVVITENGIGTQSGQKSIRYFREHIAQVRRAMAEGVDVRGYFPWTLVDNYEWKEGWAHAQFGLFSYDKKTHERIPNPAAVWYSKFIKANPSP